MAGSWLCKTEPDVYSIDDLRRDGTTGWEGVRNYQARNFMRDGMAPGDRVLVYHSNTDPAGVAGIAEVVGEAIPDPTQFDPESEFHDPKSSRAAPRWLMRRLRFVERFGRVVTLEELRADAVEHGLGFDDAGSQPRADVGDDRLGGGRPHVGLDERGPELGQELVVDQPPLLLEQVADVGREHLGGLGKARLEPVEKAHPQVSSACASATSRPRIPATNRGDDSPP